MIFKPIWLHIGRQCLTRHLARLRYAMLQLFEQLKDELSATLGQTAGGFARETIRLILGVPTPRPGPSWQQRGVPPQWGEFEGTPPWFEVEQDWQEADFEELSTPRVQRSDKAREGPSLRARLWRGVQSLCKSTAVRFLACPYVPSLARATGAGLLLGLALFLGRPFVPALLGVFTPVRAQAPPF